MSNKYISTVRKLGITGSLDIFLKVFALAYWFLVFWYARTTPIPRPQYGVLFLAASLIFYIFYELMNTLRGKHEPVGYLFPRGFEYVFGENWREKFNKLDAAFLILLLVPTFYVPYYMYTNFNDLFYQRRGIATDFEIFLSAVIVAIILYLTFRAFGWLFFGVIISSFVYGLYGQLFPSILWHFGFSVNRMLMMLVWEFEGFFGSLIRIVGTWVAPFFLFAGLLKAYGAFDYIFELSLHISKYISSGVAQTAVVASLIIGSINGAQTANAAMTGSITIPLMQESGVKSRSAAAIEAVASAGGQIMPPIMGAAAFLMASFLGIAYIDIVIAALLPAGIFFISVAMGVHYMVTPQIKAFQKERGEEGEDLTEMMGETSMSDTEFRIEGMDSDEVQKDVDEDEYDEEHKTIEEKSTGEIILDLSQFVIPFGLLLYLLGVMRWTIMTSALWGTVSLMVLGFAIPLVKATLYEAGEYRSLFANSFKETVQGYQDSAVMLVPIVIIVASIGAFVHILQTSGLPGLFALTLLDISGGVMLFAILLTMIICIILGLGLPTVAAYTVVALLIAPALIRTFMVPELAAHFFVLYAAILSGLTPPIAVGIIVTTGIAQSNFWRTCVDALKISFPLYILPITLVYNPEIVTGSITTPSVLFSFLLILAGALFLANGLNDFSSRYLTRLLYVGAGIFLMTWPGITIRLGVFLVVGLYAVFINGWNAIAEEKGIAWLNRR